MREERIYSRMARNPTTRGRDPDTESDSGQEVGKEGGLGGEETAAGASSFRADLGSTQSGRRPFTLMHFEILKNVGLLWGYKRIRRKKRRKTGKKKLSIY